MNPALFFAGLLGAALGLGLSGASAESKITIGYRSGAAAVAIPLSKADPAVEAVPFAMNQPIALAVAAGALDIGLIELTANFYNLAKSGAIKIVAVAPAAPSPDTDIAFLASPEAWRRGLQFPHNIAGKTMGIQGLGQPDHMRFGRLAMNPYGHVDLDVVPLFNEQGLIRALRASAVDAVQIGGASARLIERAGEGRIIGWAIGARLRALIVPRHGGIEAARAALLAGLSGMTADVAAEIRAQVAWYQAQGFVDADVDTEKLF